MDQNEYERLRQQIIDERQRDLDALDRVWNLLRHQNQANDQMETGSPQRILYLPSPIESDAAQSTAPARGEVTGVVRSLIETYRGQFTIRELLADCQAKVGWTPNSTSVNAALRKMRDANEIVVEIEGSGRTPSTYRKGPSWNRQG